MTKVIVTGAAGHLGSGLVGKLLAAGDEVVGIDHLLYGGEGLLPFLSHPMFRFQKMDLRSSSIENAGDADYVVHLAAIVGPACEQATEIAWDTNCGATARICESVERSGARLLFASTCSNYGISDGIATETSDLRPLGTYAETKVAAEKLVSELGDQAVTLRFATLAGLSPRPRFDTLLNQLSYEAVNKGRIECYQPRAWRPFLHVADAARCLETVLLRCDDINSPCYNVVVFNVTKRQLADEIAAQTGCQVGELSDSSDRRDYSVSDELIRHELGFGKRFSMSDCVEEVCTALKLGVLEPRSTHYNA